MRKASRFLSIFLSILHILHCSCPPGLKPVRNGECRGLYEIVDLPNTEATDFGLSKCKDLHAQPVIIHNEEQGAYWADMWTRLGNWILLGIVCDSSSKRWEWADGSPFDYKPQYYNYALNGECNAGCVWQIDNDLAAWEMYCNTDNHTYEIACIAQLHQPVPPKDGCYSFEDDSEDGVCYQVGAVAENWQDAQLICRELGGNLASLHNLNENSFVRRMAVSIGAVNGLFLGATISGKGTEFGWVDGSKWDYENFYPGFPKKNTGDCLAMDTSTSTGQWMNIECSTKLPVACIRDLRAFTEIPEPTCSTADWEEGQLITSPGYPFTASLSCDFFLTADEGTIVKVEIISLEANSCCDFVIIHDGFLGGSVIANLTGAVHNVTYTSTSNFMRVSWQPNGGVNVKGLAMTFRGV